MLCGYVCVCIINTGILRSDPGFARPRSPRCSSAPPPSSSAVALEADIARLEEDAEELFGTVDDAEACSRYDCGTIAQMTLSKGANVHYTDVQCIAAFDKDACASHTHGPAAPGGGS